MGFLFVCALQFQTEELGSVTMFAGETCTPLRLLSLSLTHTRIHSLLW